MRAVLRNEFKRAFLNPGMALVILAEVVLVAIYMVQEVLPVCYRTNPYLYSIVDTGKVRGIMGVYYTWIGFNYSQCRTILFTVLPLLAALPYGASLYQDEKKRYVENVMVRCKRSEYYLTKLIVLFVSGGVIAVFPFILNFLSNMLFLPFERVVPESAWFTMRDPIVASELFYDAPIVYVFLYLLVLFVGFGLLNCLCFPASYLFANGFVVMTVPFAVYYGSFLVASLFGDTRASLWNSLRFNIMERDYMGSVMAFIAALAVVIVVCVVSRARKHSDIIS